MRGLGLVIWGSQERQFPAIFPLTPLILGEMIIPRSLAMQRPGLDDVFFDLTAAEPPR